MYRMLRALTALAIFLSVFAPSACPMAAGMRRCFAQRRLPSIMKAMCFSCSWVFDIWMLFYVYSEKTARLRCLHANHCCRTTKKQHPCAEGVVGACLPKEKIRTGLFLKGQ